ncbi:MAG TPA: nitrogen fixation protein NifU [Pseudonocardiaceae bacterium]
MTGTMRQDDRSARERVELVDTLLERVEALPDEEGRVLAVELARALLDLYGEALARITTLVAQTDPAVGDRLVEDELVTHLLLLHGLHPDTPQERVRRAVEQVRSRTGVSGIELVGLDEGVARVRLPAGGCRASGAAVRAALEEAVVAAAPEVTAVEIVQDAPAPAFIPAESLFRQVGASGGRGA